ncbi:thioredoxin domain-containing protein [Enteractinococcus fodinae]|uniref:Protein-disulfide isomerase n=1 Tax=Enteractinococcus fodinae TaxID=684663 RepID=A0ABU2B5E7_9MICC|nr:thioredoxin domain-containing protein [Enteractinococcus fodinae]MDR7347619.1 protein-disulfide isomerase [Enteractinococcus fodinae]
MSTSHKTTSTRLWVMPTLIVLGAVIALVAVFFWGRSTATTEADSQPPAAQQETEEAETVPPEIVEQVIRRDAEDPLAVGQTDAPVVMVMFSDYQCPFCGRWTAETLPEMQQFVDAGELRIEFRDVNMYGEDSRRAASASVAAAEQGEFTDYHARLFDGGETLDGFSAEALTDIAAEMGMDTDQFQADMDSEKTAEIVQTNEQLGQELGATSTPSFIINDTPVVGAQPADVFIDAVEEALANTQE